MTSKVIILPLFGDPYPWIEKYFDNCADVKGWDWMVFTPHEITGRKNVHIRKMDIETFCDLLREKTDISTNNFIVNGAPYKFISDYYPAFGHIFEDYLDHFDFWGHSNWDVVYGNLSKWIPDVYLDDCDIFADDVERINGTFTIYRNTGWINYLYEQVPGWQEDFTKEGLAGFDEIRFADWLQANYKQKMVKFKFPLHFPYHSYDRLIQHYPTPQLTIVDGSLYEKFTDQVTGKTTGKEIMWFHFSRTKQYPI